MTDPVNVIENFIKIGFVTVVYNGFFRPLRRCRCRSALRAPGGTVSVRDVRLVERASLLCGTAVGPVLRVRRESAAEPDVT